MTVAPATTLDDGSLSEPLWEPNTNPTDLKNQAIEMFLLLDPKPIPYDDSVAIGISGHPGYYLLFHDGKWWVAQASGVGTRFRLEVIGNFVVGPTGIEHVIDAHNKTNRYHGERDSHVA